MGLWDSVRRAPFGDGGETRQVIARRAFVEDLEPRRLLAHVPVFMASSSYPTGQALNGASGQIPTPVSFYSDYYSYDLETPFGDETLTLSLRSVSVANES